MSRASRAIHSFHRLSGAGERPTLKAEQGETNRTNLADVQSKVVLDPRDSGSVAGSPTKVRDDHLSFSINRRAWGDGTQSVVIGARQTSGRALSVVSFVYLSAECPFNKFYGINGCPKLDAKLIDRFFHRRRQVSPPVNSLTHRFFDGSQHLLHCNVTVRSRHGVDAPSSSRVQPGRSSGRFAASLPCSRP